MYRSLIRNTVVALSIAGLLLSGAVWAGGRKNLGDMKLDSKLSSMKKAGVGPVIFPHTKHEKIYKCGDCHPKIFKEKRGANDISMKKNMNLQFCGSQNCHNSRKAFPLFQCAKCHTHVGAAK